MLLERATLTPPALAGAVRVTVPVEVVPPLTLDGLNATDVSPIEVIVRVADFVLPVVPAVIVAVV